MTSLGLFYLLVASGGTRPSNGWKCLDDDAFTKPGDCHGNLDRSSKPRWVTNVLCALRHSLQTKTGVREITEPTISTTHLDVTIIRRVASWFAAK